MKRIFNRISIIVLGIIFAIACVGCNSVSSTNKIDTSEDEKYEQEQYEFEHFYFETYEQLQLFYEYLEEEQYELELELPDDVENEVYLFEEEVEEDFSESFFNRIPTEVLLYDIDWQTVLTKYAVGTAIIVIAGTLTLATLNTPICYVFATSFKEATKQALIGGTVGAALNVVIGSISDGSFNKVDAVKYAIEGSADGFMWGAISGAVLGAVNGAKMLNTPGNYFSSDGTKLLGHIDDSGNFFDDTERLIGTARKAANGNTYIVDESGKVVYMFSGDSKLASETIVKAYNDINVIKSAGRYAGSNLTLGGADGTDVYKGSELIGHLNEAGDVIGTGKYEGELLYSINADGYVSCYYYRAIQGGITTDSVGNITNAFIMNQGDDVLKGGAEVYGYYVLDNGAKASVVQYSTAETTCYYLMGENDKILACLDDSMQIMEGWNTQIAKAANSGVKSAKSQIIALIQNDVPYDPGPSFTDDVVQYIKEMGKFPSGFQGHHINNVANYPWLADNCDNIIYYTRSDHLLYGHNGSWANSSSGDLTDLLEIYQKVFGG